MFYCFVINIPQPSYFHPSSMVPKLPTKIDPEPTIDHFISIDHFPTFPNISQHFPTSISILFPSKDLFEIFPSVTVRLLDAPLHEFLPTTEAGLAAVAAIARGPSASLERVKRRTAQLREANPMLGCLVKS